MTNNTVKKSSNISIKVGLNDKNVPVRLDWKAEDNPKAPDYVECKAMLLSIFDKEHKDTMKIDLWTTEMQIQEMDRFFFQTFRALADTYQRATKNNQLAEDVARFAHYFGEQTGIIPKEEKK